MKYKLLIFGLIICFGCNQKETNKSKISQEQIDNKNDSNKLEALDKEPENVLFSAFNGVVYDTIFLDSLIDKAIINDTLSTDYNYFISYSVSAVGESVKGEPVSKFKGHFINSFDLQKVDYKLGDTINLGQLDTINSSFNLGSSCSNEDDIIKFENRIDYPDSKIRFYMILPQCSEWYDHILLEKQGENFVELFSIHSTDNRLSFDFKNDTILIFDYVQSFDDGIDRFKFEYDLKNSREIE